MARNNFLNERNIKPGLMVANTLDSKNIDYVLIEKNPILGKKLLLTGGGRCYTVVSTGENTLEACENAYKIVKNVSFPGSWYRKDIARKFFK